MIQAGDRFGFALKTLFPNRVIRELVGKNLDGYRAL
jgi:hypothetical protein